MDDDFNTAGAIAAIFETLSMVNSDLDGYTANGSILIKSVKDLLDVLGIRSERAKQGGAGDSEKLIELLMQFRMDARAAKQFQLADKIRDGLKGLGYEVEDLPGGKWNVKKSS